MNEALEAVNGALVPFIKGLPVGEGMAAQFRISRKICDAAVTVFSSLDSASRQPQDRAPAKAARRSTPLPFG